jgi:hypothetical protein
VRDITLNGGKQTYGYEGSQAVTARPCDKSMFKRRYSEDNCSKERRYEALSRFGGVVVSVLATGIKGRGFRTGRGNVFLWAIKIRSTPSFGWEVKPEVPCRKILRNVKDPLTLLRYRYAKLSILRPFHLLAPRCLCS